MRQNAGLRIRRMASWRLEEWPGAAMTHGLPSPPLM